MRGSLLPFSIASLLFAVACGDDGSAADEGGETGTTGDDAGTTGNPDCFGCFIGGVCYARGVDNPQNECQVCDVDLDAEAWTQPDGKSCNDGLFCNGMDTCQAGACTVHGGDPCTDDGQFCNGVELCDEQARWCVSPGNPCASGEACAEAEGACCQPAVALGCDPDGNVVELDSCGRLGAFVRTCPDLANGLCDVGVCGCVPGFGGADCNRCVVYVDGDQGDDMDDGATWSSAKATVQVGLDTAQPSGCEVWVARSATPYVATSTTSRTISIQLHGGVALYGGFAGGEVSLSQRDLVANETVLSGDIGTPGVASDNTCHVVTGTDAALIDGFTIDDGNAGAGCPTQSGGGMWITAGTMQAANLRFVGNHAEQSGGALFVAGGDLTVSGNTFSGNTSAGDGGAISAFAGVTRLDDGHLEGNSAANNGGAVAIGTGALLTDRSLFIGNTAGSAGGAISTPECVGIFEASYSVFHSNVAAFGGALSVETNDGFLRNVVIAANHASVAGGGMTSGECNFGGVNTIIWHNTEPNPTPFDAGCNPWSYSNIETWPCAGINQNIHADPRFARSVGTPDEIDLGLQPGSPCIDVGNDQEASIIDLLGNFWFDDLDTDNCDLTMPGADECLWISDLGPYEYTGL